MRYLAVILLMLTACQKVEFAEYSKITFYNETGKDIVITIENAGTAQVMYADNPPRMIDPVTVTGVTILGLKFVVRPLRATSMDDTICTGEVHINNVIK